MKEIPFHKQSNGPTSKWIHSVVWETSELKENRGSLVVRVVEDVDAENVRNSRCVTCLYEDIDAGWFDAIDESAKSEGHDSTVESVVRILAGDLTSVEMQFCKAE